MIIIYQNLCIIIIQQQVKYIILNTKFYIHYFFFLAAWVLEYKKAPTADKARPNKTKGPYVNTEISKK